MLVVIRPPRERPRPPSPTPATHTSLTGPNLTALVSLTDFLPTLVSHIDPRPTALTSPTSSNPTALVSLTDSFPTVLVSHINPRPTALTSPTSPNPTALGSLTDSHPIADLPTGAFSSVPTCHLNRLPPKMFGRIVRVISQELSRKRYLS